MTKLEELINEFCPDGVEYYSLSELFIQFSGMGGVSNKWADSGNCQFIDYMNAYNNISIDVTNLPYATVKNLNQFILRQGDILFTSASETPDECAYSSVIEDEITDGIFMDDHLFGLRIKDEYIKNISPSYLKYAFRSVSFRKQIKKAVRGVTRFYVSKPDFMKLLIPLPPLSIQSEIVHILDSFTLLTAELTAELTARQKQYAFYRDYLLDFSNEDVTKKIPDIDCSNVEYKRLGDIATAIYRGAGIKRDEVTETGIPCVRYGEIYTTYNVTFNNCVSHTDEDKIQNKKYFEHGDVLFAITGESVEEIAKSCVYLGHDKCLAGGDIVVLKHNQNPKYMAYVLSTTNAQSQKSKGKVKSKVVHSSVPAISDIIIPIPPLAEQEKIANMIVRFDHLCNDISNGLPAEIEARKKQYEYYRDTLLSFDDKACSHIVKVERERELTRTKAIKWLKLSDIVTIERGKRVVRNDLSQEIGYPVYQNALKPLGYYTDKNRNANSVFVIGAGAAGEIGYSYVDYWAADDCFTFVCDDKLNQRYLYFLLMSKQAYLKNNVRKSSIPRLPRIALENMEIPVPPLEEQERIVSILDRFDKLCNDISEGLPAEIEARQKQYEYYRDKLLSFKEKNHA